MGWVATSSPDGTPNVTPKGTLRVLDDQHVMFADLFSLKTRQNLEKNPKVAVTVIDTASAKGYQLKGRVELISSGPLFKQFEVQLNQAMLSLPPLKYVVKIAVESAYDQSAGPDAGKQIA
jgi:hypothetical protein